MRVMRRDKKEKEMIEELVKRYPVLESIKDQIGDAYRLLLLQAGFFSEKLDFWV